MAIDITSHFTAMGVDRAMEELLSPFMRMDRITNTNLITTTAGDDGDGERPDHSTSSAMGAMLSPPHTINLEDSHYSTYESWDVTVEDSTASFTGIAWHSS